MPYSSNEENYEGLRYNTSMQISIPVGIGELYDKVSILEIKSERMTNKEKLKYVQRELSLLREIAARHPVDENLYRELKEINEKLWDVENGIRREEARQTFGEEFIRLARSVYTLNDRRADIKRQINIAAGSDIVEMKSY